MGLAATIVGGGVSYSPQPPVDDAACGGICGGLWYGGGTGEESACGGICGGLSLDGHGEWDGPCALRPGPFRMPRIRSVEPWRLVAAGFTGSRPPAGFGQRPLLEFLRALPGAAFSTLVTTRSGQSCCCG